ncbi:hypothetical protein FMEXI_13919 [Fusarium mexicanum]|uniref:DUF7918 domain-containing protein n=1 Tax=Fusarium mexicanum TaxID=751941 RepID=A0A8H5I8N3_9HYPO|nr:hypothetical protein FMEXI_13919 [Fusarium mexicanum]
MAVLPGVPGIEVRIVVDGLPTQEWPFEENKKREVSDKDVKADEHKVGSVASKDAHLPTTHNYIVSKTGCHFGVSLALSPDLKTSSLPATTDAIGIHIHIDGTFFDRFLVGFEHLKPQKWNYMPPTWDFKLVKTEDGTTKRECPVFSDIVSVEDPDGDKTEADMARVKTMGTIRLTVWAAKRGEAGSYEVTETPKRSEMELAHKATILHGEGLTHGTTFKDGDIDESDRQRFEATVLKKLGEFIYKYSAHSPEEAKKLEMDSSVPSKRKYEEVKMPDGRCVLDLTGDDDS